MISSRRSVILVILVSAGLVVPAVPAGAGCCHRERPEPQVCGAGELPVHSCCAAEADQVDEQRDAHTGNDGDCCGDDCKCTRSCCAHVTPLVHTRSATGLADLARSGDARDPGSSLSPQDFAGELLDPPQA